MCEPYHSIVQYGQDDDDNNLSGQAGSYIYNKLGDWSKAIGRWLHLSKFGSGHSNAVGRISHHVLCAYDDNFIKYEAAWWDRDFKQDGKVLILPDQFDCAKLYAEQTSIGSLQQLRNFLEISITKSERPYLYAEAFFDYFLNVTGKRKFQSKFSAIFKTPFTERSVKKLKSESLAKLLIGYTRKENLIVPEWVN